MNDENKITQFVIRTKKSVKTDYINYCNNNGFTMSKRLMSLLLKDMEGKITIEK
jgi:hypothetical protein